MPDQTIVCPHCGQNIPLSQALSEQMKHEAESELNAEFQKKLAAQQTKLEEEKKRLWQVAQEKAKEKIEGEFKTELKDLQEQFQEKAKLLAKAEVNELELRKKTRELEEQKRNLDLEMQRKLDEERLKIAAEARKTEADQQRLKVAEKDKQIEQMQRTIEDLRRQSQQGSMQIQGDVQENDLKQLLSTTFFMDTISDVPTGVKGADLVQEVHTQLGQKAGLILWESKNTKAWSQDWVTKLKQDQGKAGADVCLLVSQVLPKDIKGFGVINGVWVLEYQYIVPLVTTLRYHLLELAKLQSSMVGRDQKMEYLYAYLSGSQFKNRIEMIVTSFTAMQDDLAAERRAMERMWRKRGQEIEHVIENTSGLYGDLQGIVGRTLPTISSLELPGETEEVVIEETSLFIDQE